MSDEADVAILHRMFEKMADFDGWWFTSEEGAAIERVTGKKLFEPKPCPCDECVEDPP